MSMDEAFEPRFAVSHSSSMWLGNYEALAPRIVEIRTGRVILDAHATSWDSDWAELSGGRFRLRLAASHNRHQLVVLGDAEADQFRFEGEGRALPLEWLPREVERRLEGDPRDVPPEPPARFGQRERVIAALLLVCAGALVLMLMG
jgi:hypothetical protein